MCPRAGGGGENDHYLDGMCGVPYALPCAKIKAVPVRPLSPSEPQAHVETEDEDVVYRRESGEMKSSTRFTGRQLARK